ncbi:MAG: sulfotransferase family protein [Paracoccaceae bacterium]
MPDFLVIGAARAGTTAIHSFLRKSPRIFMPAGKEPNFFAFEGEALSVKGPGAEFINNSITTLPAYNGLFAGAASGQLLGEASPLYLYVPKAPERIRHHVPDVRMVAVLRNPVDQAWSHFMYATKFRIETVEDFAKALALEEERLAEGWQPLFGYSRFPRYAEQLERYFRLFPREQILIRTYDDFLADPARLMADILTHIGADASFRPDMEAGINAGGRPKSKVFQDFLMKSNPITRAIGLVVPREVRWRIRDRLARINMKKDEAMPADAKAILLDRLGPEIRRLEPMIGRDLSAWLA